MPTLEAIQASIQVDSTPEPAASSPEPISSSPAVEPATATTEPSEPSADDVVSEPPAAPDTATPDDDFIKWVSESFPDHAATIGNYKSGEELIKGLLEKDKLIGQRNEDAALVKRMREAGVTDADIAEVLERKNGRTKPPEPAAPAKPSDVEYDPKWVTFDEKGLPILTAEGRRVPNVEDKIAVWRSKMNEAMWNPALMAELVGKHLKSDDGQVTAALQEMQAKEYARTQQDWIKGNSKEIYSDPADRTLSPLGLKIDALLKDPGFYPTLDGDFMQRADKAKEFAMAMIQPTPAKRHVPLPAKHQTPIGGGDKVKLTMDQFKKKYTNYSLAEFIDFTENGKEPQQ